MDSSDDRIVIENVNVPGSTTRVSKAMYDAMQQAISIAHRSPAGNSSNKSISAPAEVL